MSSARRTMAERVCSLVQAIAADRAKPTERRRLAPEDRPRSWRLFNARKRSLIKHRTRFRCKETW